MKQDPIFIFSAYIRNKLSGTTMRIARAIMKLRRVNRDLDDKDINDVIQDLMKIDQKVSQLFSRTDQFLGKLRSRQHKKKIR